MIVTIARNDAFRQVFALSVHLGKDMWFCAVDSDTNKVSTIFETVNAGSSWAPIFATLSKGVRDFVVVNDNTDNTASPYVNNTVLALLSDPANGDDMLVRTTDGGDSWSAVTFTRSTAPAETGLLSGALEGDQKSGGSRVIVGSARQVGNTATVFISTDSGATFGSPIAVATGHNNIWWVEYISGTGASGIWLAFCHDQGGTLAPVVYQTTDGGANWSSLSTVGAAGDVWQAVHKTSQGTLLATTNNNGRVYRSTNNGASWTLVFEAANVIATETKVRRFIENSTAIYCVSQNAGYLWRSTDDGVNYTVIDRAGRQFGPICFSGTETRILIGGGQGFTGAGPGRAEMYVATIVDK
ncbi:exo-alpha-sialidase [Exilibacterium tricleocarpae]|uniref:Exo-alpha-sialidase n=1 Tax=Exilibacterium tricleocarpae TaxID=2591008 RepID=A0A545SLA2_9GAMM|nr:sialidase family protein [Exilibacterium tricleocarpae]TQV65755.1 exo-alpha-sialidase [Exilibacterium tricleocarpae]